MNINHSLSNNYQPVCMQSINHKNTILIAVISLKPRKNGFFK